MKTILIVLTMMVGSKIVVYGQDSTGVQHDYDVEQQEEVQIVNEKIEPRELPDAIKKTLESQSYHGWLINAVYKEPVGETDSTNSINGVVYLVEMLSGARTKTVRFDKDGKELPDK